GIWGAQVKDTTIHIPAGSAARLSFTLESSDCDKWVFIKVTNENRSKGDTPVLYGDWVKVPAGCRVNYDKMFTVDADATAIWFGIGGEMGDRPEQGIYDYCEDGIPNDLDATYYTTLTMSNYSLTPEIIPYHKPTDVRKISYELPETVKVKEYTHGKWVDEGKGKYGYRYDSKLVKKENSKLTIILYNGKNYVYTYKKSPDGSYAFLDENGKPLGKRRLSIKGDDFDTFYRDGFDNEYKFNVKLWEKKGIYYEASVPIELTKNPERNIIRKNKFLKHSAKPGIKSAINRDGKIKITFKSKYRNVKGYEFRFFKSEASAKRNKYPLKKYVVEKNVKNFELKAGKLSKRNKLFVRVRGYKVIGNKRVYSPKWSYIKPVKTN
ncbi:MAG: hypothetical protein IKN54_00415, partial [Lachnospiraceae bacterium]|nr:hypothetical protein [Lachnospiraceae bacterium]